MLGREIREFMFGLIRPITLVLVAQLVLGPVGATLSDAQQRGGRFDPRGRESEARGKRFRPEIPSGVVSRTPAKELLPGGQALSRAVVPDQYILGPGDSLSINLWGEYDDIYLVRVIIFSPVRNGECRGPESPQSYRWTPPELMSLTS